AHYRFPNRFPNDVTGADIIREARGGSAEALQIVEASADALGRGIALLIDLLNPQIVVLGSLAGRAGDLFLPIAERGVAKEASPECLRACRIVPAALGKQIG
ncbi:MAG TPA: sugar kinase, partial [Planctomycetaceae bacterium]|nr:sugar kinase [Planctomycetaceae bacterium]